ncbi:MAG: flagellar motor switch protein FliN [Candidatus Hydrogenedentes bacterium]|nr:flagellar motor switch protein FliN [Candidatus Hydrogenedentota bacterium]
MNAAVAKLFADGYLKGFFGTVGLMLSNSPTFELGEPDDLSLDGWPDLVARYSGALRASVSSGGGIVVLLSAADINTIAALFEGQEPAAAAQLDPGDLAKLKEIFEPCLGGGASYFKEQYEREVPLTDIAVAGFDVDAMDPLGELLGDDVTIAPFRYAIGDAAGKIGALLFSQALEEIIPAAAAEAAPSSAPGESDDLGPSISQDELDSILQGATKQRAAAAAPEAPPAAAPAAAPAAVKAAPASGPSNIDMVLDIQLTATARLGRIEMPISDILALGPGSIIEVGHLVDEPIELLVNDKLIARGDVVVVDEKFGLRITEIISPQERIESLR